MARVNTIPASVQQPDASRIAVFRRKIYRFYKSNYRPMPWRDTRDPYHILVSEIMLQQTQVPRVLEKYPQFIAKFPNFAELARAPLRDVLASWQGLGYNRRALMLQKLARVVIEQHQGSLPSDPALLQALPGIGSYTAAAIRAFVFNQPSAFIETNIRAVFIHEFFASTVGIHDRDLLPLVEQTLDKKNPRDWYYALMDYGNYLKKHEANPARRSAHHVRQSRFVGSDRQIRGKILALLVKTPMTEKELYHAIQDNRLPKILGHLTSEELITKKKTRYRIADARDKE